MLYLHFVQTTLYWNSIWYCFNSTGYKIGNGSGCKPRSIGGRLEMSTVLILPSDWLRFRKKSLFCTWIRDQLCVLPIVTRGLVCWGIGKNKGYLAFVKICGFAHVSERVKKESFYQASWKRLYTTWKRLKDQHLNAEKVDCIVQFLPAQSKSCLEKAQEFPLLPVASILKIICLKYARTKTFFCVHSHKFTDTWFKAF